VTCLAPHCSEKQRGWKRGSGLDCGVLMSYVKRLSCVEDDGELVGGLCVFS
jgi:hypothetical protein